MCATLAKVLSELFGLTGVSLRDAVEVEKHGGLEGCFCSAFRLTSASVALKVFDRKNALWNIKQ